MINSVFVLFAALVVFAFGYRFFSKFLAVWVFRSDATYSTPVPAAADSADPISSTRHMPLAQHIGSLAAAVTIIGSTLAVAWGWIPVFLWVTVGSVVAAGTYAMG
ncbi:MAG: carbon starvation CstA family protein, partial [Acidiferrobacterales bacterium]